KRHRYQIVSCLAVDDYTLRGGLFQFTFEVSPVLYRRYRADLNYVSDILLKVIEPSQRPIYTRRRNLEVVRIGDQVCYIKQIPRNAAHRSTILNRYSPLAVKKDSQHP